MKAPETRQYAMLVRVRDFGEAHRDLFSESTVGGQTFATVAAAVAQLSGHARSKLSTPREGTASKRSARLALIERLEAIGRTARVIADKGAPAFDDSFRLPQLRRETDEVVLTVGRAFARDAEAVKSQFIAHGMPEKFGAHLVELVERFEEAIRGQDEVRTTQAAAKAGTTEALKFGLAASRELDVLVANHLQDDRIALAVWRRERRIGHPRKSRRRSTAETTASVTAPRLVDSAPTSPVRPVAPAPVAVAAPSVAESKPLTATNVNVGTVGA